MADYTRAFCGRFGSRLNRKTGCAWLILLVSLAAMFRLSAAEAEAGKGAVELTFNGAPRAIVVIAENPTRAAHVAAKEFICYVKKITGVELRLYVDGAAPPPSHAPRRVLIGESLETRALGLTNSNFQAQEYLVETRGSILILMGRDAEEYGIISYEENGLWPTASRAKALNTALGSLYAVHTFLEQCGVRWYLPGEIGEVCPRQQRLMPKDLQIRTKPWTRWRYTTRVLGGYRDPFHFYGYADPDKLVSVPARDLTQWLLRMKICMGVFACMHSFGSYEKRFVKEHPEWWKEGHPTSAWPHPDYANPKLISQVTQDALDYYAGKFTNGTYPDGSTVFAAGNYFAVMPLDGRKGLIWSEAGERLRNNDPDMQNGFSCGWGSDFVFNMVSEVARGVADKYPQALISCAAYGPYFNPPRRQKNFPGNIAIQQCGWMHRSFSPAEWDFQARNLQAWKSLAKELYVWEYYLEQGLNRFQSLPAIFPHQVARAMQFFHDTGVQGMFFEASAAPAPGTPWTDNHLANPAEDMLNHYVTWKYLCDASLNIDKLLEEHYRLFYGPAAKPMQEFFALIEAQWAGPTNQAGAEAGLEPGTTDWRGHDTCTLEIIRKLEPKIKAALAAAKDEPYRSRVELMYKSVYQLTERKASRNDESLNARRRVYCPLVSQPPVVDGRTDDVCWTNTEPTGAFVSSDGISSEVATTARILRSDSMLFVAFSCPEITPAPSVAVASTNAAPATNTGDHVLIALDVDRTRQRAYGITIQRTGTVQSVIHADGKETAWTTSVQVAVSEGTDGWSVEAAIPLASLDGAFIVPGTVWGLNLGRYRASINAIAEEHLTVWSPTFGGFMTLPEFGVLDFTPRVYDRAHIPQPLIRYDFEELVGNKYGPDRAGVSAAGTQQFSLAWLKTGKGGTNWTAQSLIPGLKGQALRFGGPDTQQYLELAIAPVVNVTNDDFTISFWCKPEKPGGTLLASTTSKPYWTLSLNKADEQADLLSFALGSATNVNTAGGQSSAVPLADGKWHHMVLTFDRGRAARMYVDKALVGTVAIGGQQGNLKRVLTIGGPYNFLRGVLDEFAVYPGSFGQAQVDALYQRESNTNQPPAPAEQEKEKKK